MAKQRKGTSRMSAKLTWLLTSHVADNVEAYKKLTCNEAVSSMHKWLSANHPEIRHDISRSNAKTVYDSIEITFQPERVQRTNPVNQAVDERVAVVAEVLSWLVGELYGVTANAICVALDDVKQSRVPDLEVVQEHLKAIERAQDEAGGL